MLGGPPRPSPRSHPVHPGQGWPAALSRLRPGPQGCAARGDRQEPDQAYLFTPGFPFTRALSLTAPGSRVGALRRAGEAPCRTVPGHPAQGPQLQRELSERGTMRVSHRLTCGPSRVSSLQRHLSAQRASSRPTPRGPGQRTPWLPLLPRRSMTRRSARPLLLQAFSPPHLPRSVESSIAPPSLGLGLGLGPAPVPLSPPRAYLLAPGGCTERLLLSRQLG